MGFFSWITQDTNRSVSNTFSFRDTFPVYMHDNKGNKWIEHNYNGYGEFGGKDYYELLAEMNGKETREEGIDIAFSGKPYISPNISQSKDWKWINSAPQSCKNQGYFYDSDEDEIF